MAEHEIPRIAFKIDVISRFVCAKTKKDIME